MTEESDIKQRIVSGFAWEFATRMIIQAVSWISTFLVARVLNPADYGIVAISGVFTGLFLMISNLGLSAGLVHRPSITKEERDGVFWLSLMLSVVMYAVLYMAAPFISSFYPDMPLLPSILRVAGLMMIFSSLNVVPTAMTMRRLNFKFASLVELGVQFITTFGTLWMAFTGHGAWSLIVPVVAGQIFSVLAYARQHEGLPSLRFKFHNIVPIARYGAALISARMLEFFQQQVGTFISGSVLGKNPVGYFFYASQLAGIPLSKLGGMFQKVAFPAFSSVNRSSGSVLDVFLTMHRYLLLVASPILVGMALVAHDLTVVLVTERWLPMVPVLQMLAVLNIFRISAMLIPTTLECCGNAKASLHFQLVSCAVLPLAMFAGVQHGLIPMVAALCAAYPLVYIYLVSKLVRQFNFPVMVFFKSWTPVVVANTLMAITVFVLGGGLIKMEPLMRLVSIIPAAAIVYTGSLMIFFPREWAHLKKGLSVLRRKRAV